MADRYGGAIIKEAEAKALHASRRKAVTISFARCAAERLSRISTPSPWRKHPTW